MLHYIRTNTNAFYPLTPSYCALTRLNVFPSPSLILRFLSKISPFFQYIKAFSSRCVFSNCLSLSLSLSQCSTRNYFIYILLGKLPKSFPLQKNIHDWCVSVTMYNFKGICTILWCIKCDVNFYSHNNQLTYFSKKTFSK